MEWFSEWVALLALLFTIFVWRHDTMNTRKREDRTREDALLARASKVSCWVRRDDHGPGRDHPTVVVYNGTSEPVYQWRLRIYFDPPAKEFAYDSSSEGHIGPSGGRVELAVADARGANSRGSWFELLYSLADGTRWRRTRHGELVRDTGAW